MTHGPDKYARARQGSSRSSWSGVAGSTTPMPLLLRANGSATHEPVVMTGAALGLPGVERVFDDENIGRILDGQQFIDTIPHRLRQAMVDKHITRLIKPESGEPSFETIDDEADVIKLAGRRAPFDVVTEFGVDESRDAALDSATRLAIGAGFDALRDAGIPLVMRYKHHDARHPAARPLGAAGRMRDDTGVDVRVRVPGLRRVRQGPGALHGGPWPASRTRRASSGAVADAWRRGRDRRGRPANRRTAAICSPPSRSSSTGGSSSAAWPWATRSSPSSSVRAGRTPR